MPAFAAYASGKLPSTGDYVRSVHPEGPRNALTVLGAVPSGLRLIEDVTGRIRTIPARNLDLLHRAELLKVAS